MSEVATRPAPAPDALWSAACAMLRLELTNQQYDAYVSVARPADTPSGALRLLVPTETIANWFRTHLLGRLQELVGHPYQLDVSVAVEHVVDLFSGMDALPDAPVAPVASPAPAPAAHSATMAMFARHVVSTPRGRPGPVRPGAPPTPQPRPPGPPPAPPPTPGPAQPRPPIPGPGPEPSPGPDPDPDPIPDVRHAPAAPGRPRTRHPSGLSRHMVFDNFVAGPSNEIAFAAALKLATDPEAATTASPLYIHGAVGLGKTHLAHAIGNRFLADRPDARLRVLSGEQFMREVQADFMNNRIVDFRARFRQLDLLILDDIQLIGDDATQSHKQFLALFNFMSEHRIPIVITSDRPVKKLNRKLPPRLLSRMVMGLDVVVATPDFDTRVGILRCQSVQLLQRELPQETARLIASRLRNNCRELIGALLRLAHYADCNRIGLTPGAAAVVLRDNNAPHDLEQQDIIEMCAKHYNMRATELTGKRRTQRHVTARHVAMYLCRELTEFSLPDIGAKFACHHSSVLHATRKVQVKLHSDPDFSYEVNRLRQEIAG